MTSYTDTSGVRTHWYKIRFYDSSTGLWSDYSDPTTAEELLRLCTVDDVKRIIDTIGRWTDDEIFNTITEVDDLIYMEYGTPLQASWSTVGKIDNDEQDRYYVGEENVYRVDRLFYGTATKVELFLEDGYKANNKYGIVKILPYASSGVTLDTTCYVETHYVPGIYNKLSMYRTAERLLDKIDTTSGGETSKELEVIERRIAEVEQIIQNRIGLQLSSEVKYYDKLYGVNRKHVVQDHHRNNYIGSYGWD